jgi:hypothetical protein
MDPDLEIARFVTAPALKLIGKLLTTSERYKLRGPYYIDIIEDYKTTCLFPAYALVEPSAKLVIHYVEPGTELNNDVLDEFQHSLLGLCEKSACDFMQTCATILNDKNPSTSFVFDGNRVTVEGDENGQKYGYVCTQYENL